MLSSHRDVMITAVPSLCRQVQYKLRSGVTTKDVLVPYVTDQSRYTGEVSSLAAGHTYDITVSALSNRINGAERSVQGTTSEF